MPTAETAATITELLVKTTLLAARWAGTTRREALGAIASRAPNDKSTEITFLRDRIEQLELQVGILRKHIGKHARSPRYSVAERLHVLWYMEYFQIPRRKVSDYFGVARSTLYRWLRRIDNAPTAKAEPTNKTASDIVALVWQVAWANAEWGRVRIAQQLGLLGVFIAASTVRNILIRAKPPETPQPKPAPIPDAGESKPMSVRACYPNYVWSVDCTSVLRWGLWPTQIFVVIDHFSRKVIAVSPLEGPNAAWVCSALDAAFERYGPPRHIISDQHPILHSAAFKELMGPWKVRQRFGAVGKHGSIAVTERVIRTLKYEWLFRVPLIKGLEHLQRLCSDFAIWHNAWRPHSTLGGAQPDDVYGRDLPEPLPLTAKVVPLRIEQHRFKEARVTAYRLPRAA